MRSLFTHRPGTILVGFDAASLEARIMGHYTYPYDDGQFANELLHGDIHQLNADRFNVTRDQAKTLFYGILYGCSPNKLVTTFNFSKKRANKVWNGFWQENEALGKLRDKVIKIGNHYGHLPGIDGRAVQLRGSENAYLNALFQSAGAIAMNYSLIFLKENCNELKIKYTQCAYYHDEAVNEIPLEDLINIVDNQQEADKIYSKCGRYYSEFGEQAVLSIRQAGKHLGLRVPLDSEYQIGHTWADIH